MCSLLKIFSAALDISQKPFIFAQLFQKAISAIEKGTRPDGEIGRHATLRG